MSYYGELYVAEHTMHANLAEHRARAAGRRARRLLSGAPLAHRLAARALAEVGTRLVGWGWALQGRSRTTEANA